MFLWVLIATHQASRATGHLQADRNSQTATTFVSIGIVYYPDVRHITTSFRNAHPVSTGAAVSYLLPVYGLAAPLL